MGLDVRTEGRDQAAAVACSGGLAVGVALVVALPMAFGPAGSLWVTLAPFVAGALSFVLAPIVAVATRGRYYRGSRTVSPVTM